MLSSPEMHMILFSREKSTNHLPYIVTTFKYVDMSIQIVICQWNNKAF